MSNFARMKTATQAGQLLEGGSNSGSTLTEVTEVAKAFGLNMPEMSKDRDRLIVDLNNARSDAQKAEAKAELGRLENQIENLRTTFGPGANQNDPLRDLAVDMVKRNIERSQADAPDDPVASAYKQFIMNKTLNDLEMSQSPPTVADQVGSAVETLRAIKDLSTAFSPPPPPPTAASMSPERNLELELKKLEIEQQIEMYRINKQSETDTKKANSMQEGIKVIGNMLEGIGKSVADSLINNGAPSPSPTPVQNLIDDVAPMNPSAYGREDDGEEDSENPLVGKLMCPTCGQEAVYITQQMYDDGQAGKMVEAGCMVCGAKHELGGAEDGDDEPAPAPPSVPVAPAKRKGMREIDDVPASMRNGHERPPRRNFVSVD